ncbi:asparagine--tRNA ligase [Starmerella bacillaris]|uniref:asparagine--tRNA ligase n=1 Tax=Starmerella bacillaris TaxID=1247836 RepID=A0AAV5RMU4_STABA|nr:asparagine--tRNA ligase [Starmerella bacillaris]
MSLDAKTESLKLGDKVYVNEQKGADSDKADGSLTSPFATSAYAFWKTKNENIFVPKKLESGEVSQDEYELISASALKKTRKNADGLEKKAAKAAKAAQEQAAKDEAENARLEASKHIKIVDNDKPFVKSKIQDLAKYRDQRVSVSGWIHRLRAQKGLVFIVLRDGTGLVQIVLQGDLANAYQTSELTLESTIEVKGEIKKLPDGKTAPGGHELIADFYRVYGLAPSGEEAFSNRVQEDADPSLLLDRRHLTLRGDTLSAVFKVRAALLTAFRKTLTDLGTIEVTPPCMVQSMVEGGSTLFNLDYYGEPAYLTQSSQLYLETVVPALGNCFCIQESFRAERSHTRRHLSEYTHLEVEVGFVTFEDLLQHVEKVIIGVTNDLMSQPDIKELILQLNPKFKAPNQKFRRMRYTDALEWLNDHGIINSDTGEKFKFGDDISEAEERRMTDEINEPILLTHFPVEIKSFYMEKDSEDTRVTESVDCLLPNVGEVVGGSMRIMHYDELMAAFKREKMDPTPYEFFLDMRKYGAYPHGGYGLGVERILAWICDRFTVRECSLYPRFAGRCKP